MPLMSVNRRLVLSQSFPALLVDITPPAPAARLVSLNCR
jgi:hypothetical protein